MFTNIYPIFHKKYPYISVIPHEMNMKEQETGIYQGKIDLGFGTLDLNHSSKGYYEKLASEEILLIVPEEISFKTLKKKPSSKYPLIDGKELAEHPFVLIYKESTLRPIVDSIFKTYEIEPNILFETRSNHAILNMVKAGECCGFIPEYYAKNNSLEGTRILSLSNPIYWDITVSYKKNSYISKTTREFIELAKKYWNK